MDDSVREQPPVPKDRWTFSVWRLLIAFVLVGASFAITRPLGPMAAYGAAVVAIGLAAIALFGRWKDVYRGGLLAVGILGGGMIGSTCCGPMILSGHYGYDHGYNETEKSMLAGFIIGAIVGTVFVLQPWRGNPAPRDPAN